MVTDEPISAVHLVTSPGSPGGPGRLALLIGVVRVDEAGCVYVDADGTAVGVIWPPGFSARRAEGGTVHLHDHSGRLVATEGQEVRLGGGGSRRRGHADHCPIRPAATFAAHRVTLAD